MSSPVWLLDIDGVINAPTAPGRKPPLHVWPADDWIDTRVWGHRQRFRICVARPVVDFIREVHESGRAEIRWHTTWQDLANQLGEAVGLPELPAKNPRGWLATVKVSDEPERWKVWCRACTRKRDRLYFDTQREFVAWWREHQKDERHQRLISVEHIAAERAKGATPEERLLADIFGKPITRRVAPGVRLRDRRSAIPTHTTEEQT